MQKPVRKISNANGQKMIGRFYSYKMGCHILFESIPERNFFYMLECDSTVESYFSQPITIQYKLDGEPRRYTPDVLVKLYGSDIKIYVEVKPVGVLAYQAFQNKAKALEKAFNMLDAEFSIVSTEFTERQPHLDNCKLLHRYGGINVPSNLHAVIAEIFSKTASCGLDELVKLVDMGREGKSFIYSLIFRGAIKIEISERLTDKTKLLGWVQL